jgi:hypothetical protein
MADANISSINEALMEELFGDDGYADDEGTLILPAVTKFLDTLLSNAWNRHRKWVKADKTKLQKQREELKDLWEGASAERSVL